MSCAAYRVLKTFDGYLPDKIIWPNKVICGRGALMVLLNSGHLILESEYQAAQKPAAKVKKPHEVESAAVDYKPTRRGRPPRVEKFAKDEGESK